MKSLLAALLLAPALLLAGPAPAAAPAAPATQVVADPPLSVRQAVAYAVLVLGSDPCDALRIALGYPSVTAPQAYLRDQLALLGYEYPLPDPEEEFTCPY